MVRSQNANSHPLVIPQSQTPVIKGSKEAEHTSVSFVSLIKFLGTGPEAIKQMYT